MAATAPEPPTTALARRLGSWDVTLIVMGGIIGSGIFMNPYVVARHLHTPGAILGAWILGGLIALLGAFLYAELSGRRAESGGQYADYRDAFHPGLAFVYGWGLLLVNLSGGMAAVAITFARYLRELTGAPLPDGVTAALTLALLVVVNVLGVRAGGSLQNLFMVLKILAIVALVLAGAAFAPAALAAPAAPLAGGTIAAFGAAMVPVLFAYGGWQTAGFVGGEMRDPRRDLPRGLVAGVLGVTALYLAVNAVCLRVLGPAGLAATTTPAGAVMRAAFGEPGARWIAAGIAISTLGFLSQSMLVGPRVYYAMAKDGVFPAAFGRVGANSQAPAAAIALQGAAAILIAWSGRYEQILSYVVAVDWIFFALAGVAVFVFRRRHGAPSGPRMPGHPWTTALFTLVSAAVVAATLFSYPVQSLIGFGLLAAGVPAFLLWRRSARGA